MTCASESSDDQGVAEEAGKEADPARSQTADLPSGPASATSVWCYLNLGTSPLGVPCTDL